MPELPEVETTTRGLRKTVLGLVIKDVWTDLRSMDRRKIHSVANPAFFKTFKQDVSGKKIISVERRAKNILINLSNKQTILVHLKMTGHLMYGKYGYDEKINKWKAVEAGPLQDPFNQYIHVLFSFTNGKHLAFSDMRKFGKVVLLDTKTAHETAHLEGLGPEPLEKGFTYTVFKERLAKKPNGKAKTTLMDQTVIAGIGNIYSDEILWRAGVHPERRVEKITESEFKLIFKAIKETLARGIDFGGDSMSDYRNIKGLPGKFQAQHEAYRRTGKLCRKRGCKGIILRKVVGGRSAHFCSVHQK